MISAGLLNRIRPGLLTCLYALGVIGIIASTGGDDEPGLPPPPRIAGVWSGTWEGIDSAFGPAAGTWESRISQRDADVHGPISLGGDIDCAEGDMTGDADAVRQVVSGNVTREPCPANTWVFTAFNQDEFTASGNWEKPGLSLGTFEGQRIATFTGPRIRYIYPPGARSGQRLVIVGERLNMDPVNDSLTLGKNGTPLIPDFVSDTVITLVLPPVGVESDHLVLKTSAGKGLSPKVLDVNVTSPKPGTIQDVALAGSNPTPTSLAVSVNGRRAFVGISDDGSVRMINAELMQDFTSTIVDSGSIPVNPIHALTIDPGGRRLYAAGTNILGILHAHTLELIRTVQVASNGITNANPQGLAVSPDGRWLLVSEAIAGGRFTILNIPNNYSEENSLVMAAGNMVRGIATSPDSTQAFLAVSGNDNEVWVYDLATGLVGAQIAIGVSPAAIAVTPDGNRLYVSNAPASTINYYDLDTAGTGEIDLGAGVSANAIAITPDGEKVYVATSTNSIRIIDVATGSVDSIEVGGPSTAIGIDPHGKRAFVAISTPNKVAVIGNQRTLRVSKQGGGIGTVTSSVAGIQCGSNCIASFDEGQQLRLDAIADSGSNSRFDGWSGDPGCGGIFTMTSNRFCVAHFSVSAPPGGNDPASGCFIATAAYGSWLDPRVATLRQFRDDRLLTNSIGKLLVGFYYRHSPPIADYIREREELRVMVRVILAIVILMIEYPLSCGLAGLLLLSGILRRGVRHGLRAVQSAGVKLPGVGSVSETSQRAGGTE